MAVLADAKTVGAPFEGNSELVRVTYDFANDTGATADYTVLTAESACIVECEYLIVETEVDSAMDGTVLDLGKAAGGTQFFSNLAEAALGADAINAPTAENRFVELTAGELIVLGIETEAATAGKFHMVFRIHKKPF